MEETFELLIDGLLERQFGTAPDFLDPELLAALRRQLLLYYEEGRMHPAGIGKQFSYERNLKVRGDVIYWLEKENSPAEKAFLEQVDAFIEHLNRTCYAGINACEFHFARYEEGSFYRRHRDQFKTDQGRKFSLVTYLNEDWLPSDDGQLILYVDDHTESLLPEGGRAVFFRSDEIDHEVLPARRPRLSIAGWLKRI